MDSGRKTGEGPVETQNENGSYDPKQAKVGESDTQVEVVTTVPNHSRPPDFGRPELGELNHDSKSKGKVSTEVAMAEEEEIFHSEEEGEQEATMADA